MLAYKCANLKLSFKKRRHYLKTPGTWFHIQQSRFWEKALDLERKSGFFSLEISPKATEWMTHLSKSLDIRIAKAT